MLRTASALLVLLDTFMAVLVVDLTCWGVGEDFVGVCYLDKLLLYAFVAAAWRCGLVKSLTWVFMRIVLVRTGSCLDGISC